MFYYLLRPTEQEKFLIALSTVMYYNSCVQIVFLKRCNQKGDERYGEVMKARNLS